MPPHLVGFIAVITLAFAVAPMIASPASVNENASAASSKAGGRDSAAVAAGAGDPLLGGCPDAEGPGS